MRKRKAYYKPDDTVPAREGKEAQGKGSLVPVRGKRQFMVYTPREASLQNTLADEMLAWVMQPDTFTIKRFFHTKKMSYDDFKKRTKDNEYCLQAIIMAREILADKVQDGWRTRQIDNHYATAFLRQYDDDFRDLALLLKTAGSSPHNTGSPTVQYIEVEAIPNSPLVKERHE